MKHSTSPLPPSASGSPLPRHPPSTSPNRNLRSQPYRSTAADLVYHPPPTPAGWPLPIACHLPIPIPIGGERDGPMASEYTNELNVLRCATDGAFAVLLTTRLTATAVVLVAATWPPSKAGARRCSLPSLTMGAAASCVVCFLLQSHGDQNVQSSHARPCHHHQHMTRSYCEGQPPTRNRWMEMEREREVDKLTQGLGNCYISEAKLG